MNRREWLLGAFALTVVRPAAPDLEPPSPWGLPIPVGDADGLPFQEVEGTLNFSAYQKGREFHGLDALLSSERWEAVKRDLDTGQCLVTRRLEGEPDAVFRVVRWTAAQDGAEWAVSMELVPA